MGELMEQGVVYEGGGAAGAAGQWVEVALDPRLSSVLAALRIRHEVVGAWWMRVWVDEEADAVLEDLASSVATVRWGYEKGRELQLALPGMGEDGELGTVLRQAQDAGSQ